MEPPAPLWKRVITNSKEVDHPDPARADLRFSARRFKEFFAVDNARNIATDAAVLLVIATGRRT